MSTFKLSKEELKSFGENGFMGPYDIGWSNQRLAKLFERSKQLIECPAPTYDSVPSEKYELRTPKGVRYTKEFAKTRDHHLSDRLIYDAISGAEIVDRVGEILGPNLLLWRSQFFDNSKNSSQHFDKDSQYMTIWHQGGNFAGIMGRPAIVPTVSLTVWLSLTKSTSENGTLSVIPKTHRLGTIPLKTIDPSANDGRFENTCLGYELDYSKAVSIDVKPGQFIIFDEFLVHGSRRNLTNDHRLALTGRFTPPSTYVFKQTFPFDPSISANAPNPGGAGLTQPRLRYPVVDSIHDNWGLPLENWGCVLVAGNDNQGFNKIVQPPSLEIPTK